MGYELKVHIGEVYSYPATRENGRGYFHQLAMVELHKPGYKTEIYNLAMNKPEDAQPVYMYSMDGDTQFTEDPYGQSLVAIDPRVVMRALRRDGLEDNYPYFTIAANLIDMYLDKLSTRWKLSAVLEGH